MISPFSKSSKKSGDMIGTPRRKNRRQREFVRCKEAASRGFPLGFLAARGRGFPKIHNLERGLDALAGAVLEGDRRIDGYDTIAAINRLDDIAVALIDNAATHLARAG